jgi:glycerate-2-kinase
VSSSTTESDSEIAARANLEKIFRAAIDAVDPARLVARAMDGDSPGAEQIPDLIANASRVVLLAVGKASARMAAEIERRVGAKIVDAIAVVPKSSPVATPPQSKVRVLPAAHPIPDDSSEAAARAACEMLDALTTDDLLIVALSGGASAMFTMPAESIPLADKIAINQALLKAGASIRELNVVRKHLSAVKGGRLLRRCGGARVLGLILSDVPGNDLATIGSGLTAADWSSFADAVSVLKRRNIWGRAPESVRDYLERAAAGEFDDTVKSNDPVLERVTNVIIGDNSLALDGAERAAMALGYRPHRWKELHGEANDVGRALAEYLCGITDERICVIAGGEPVVTVRGGGRGGRAQQCALAMNIELARIAAVRRIAALFAGTDGIDGPTDAAGGFASPAIVERGARAGLSAEMAATRNDSYNFLKAAGGLFEPGPTGTNVSDVFIGLVNY